MSLSARQIKILEAIVTDYIKTAEPIGSRTIAKTSGLGISPATIRNEMSDLEDMGLISQPHTSAGRVPSHRGYRFYVDSMMVARVLPAEEALLLQRMIIDNINQMELMMQETARTISRLTSYPAIVSEPYRKKTKIRHLQLVPVDEKSILLVLVTDSKAIKNQLVSVHASPSYEALNQLSLALNQHLAGLSIKEINRQLIDKMLDIFGVNAHALMSILGAISDALQDEDDVRVFTSGVKNILAFPEFADIKKAENILHALEDRGFLLKILGTAEDQKQTGIQIAIGEENTIDLLKSCSLLRANYTIDNKNTGTIALIGPMRMDYTQGVMVLNGVLQNIQKVTAALER